MFDTFPNAHDGYGSFDDLESATVADAADFFERYYAAGNAVLAVAGDLDVARGDRADRAPLRRRAGPPGAGRGPTSPSRTSTAERRESYADRLAPLPAFAAAWRVPDPIDDFAGYLPYVVLAEVLTDGDASRLVRRLVLTDRIVTSVGGYVSFMGEPFDVRDPTALLLQAHLPPGGAVDPVLAVDGRGVSTGSPRTASSRASSPVPWPGCPPTCCATRTRCSTGRCTTPCSSSSGPTPRSSHELPRRLAEVTEEQVRAAAATLVADRGGPPIEVVPAEVRAVTARWPVRASCPRWRRTGRWWCRPRRERTLGNGLTVIVDRAAVGAAGRGAAAGAVRPGRAGPAVRGPGRAAEPDPLLRHGDDVHCGHRRRAADRRRRAVRRRRRRPAAHLRQRSGQRAGAGSWRSSPTCCAARPTPRTR